MAQKDKNILGGLNPHGLYCPITEVEQEAIQRLIDQSDLIVEIVGWGTVHKLKATIGDKRLVLEWDMRFNAPDEPREVGYFDLRLCRRSGEFLFADRKPLITMGKPIVIQTGVAIRLVWDIQIDRLPERFVKSMIPNLRGSTSRLDNTRWTDEQLKAHKAIRKGREIAIAIDKEKLDKVVG